MTFLLTRPKVLPRILPVLIGVLLWGELLSSAGGCAHSRETPRGLLEVRMIPVPGGTFVMGDVFEFEDIDATPVHEVSVENFRLAATETTYDQYDAFAVRAGVDLPDDDSLGRGSRAAVNITWDEALAFCGAYGYRLPSEMEWEFAARERGKPTLYSGTNDPTQANRFVGHSDNSDLASTHVGKRDPNSLGLYDMSGNVFEWIADYYPFYPNPGEEPAWQDLATASMRAVRGGSIRNPLEVSRTYRRASTLHTIRSSAVGFRCASD